MPGFGVGQDSIEDVKQRFYLSNFHFFVCSLDIIICVVQ